MTTLKRLDAAVTLLDPAGAILLTTSGATTFTADVAVDESTETVYSTGYKNFRTLDPGGNRFPVDVPATKATAFDGSARWRAYDWSSDETSPRWLNAPENNMADTRGTRLEMGGDGLLYTLFEADGGNHCLRYSPFDIGERVSIVGGDQYFEFFNTGTEPKTFVGRYDALTGAYLTGQQFLARLNSGRGNTVRNRTGDLAANAAGEVFIVGESASGIPLTEEHFPLGYRGGGFLLKLSSDFAERQIVTRLTRGKARAVALGPNDDYVFAGSTENELFTNNAMQASPGGNGDAWFVVSPSAITLPVRYGAFRATVLAKEEVRLDWIAEVSDSRGFRVERASGGRPVLGGQSGAGRPRPDLRRYGS